MLGGIAIATAIPLLFSHYELRAGQTANSPALIADAKEYRAHVFTTGVVFAALLGQWLGLPLDRVAALVIVIAIGKTGWELLSEGMRVLLDASLSAETLLDIRQVIQQEPAVRDIEWVTGRNAGRFRFVEAAITLRVQSLERAETVTRRIEEGIHRACPYVDRVLIHAEPVARTHIRYAIPLADAKGTMSQHLSKAPYFALLDLRLANGAIEERRILDRPLTEGEKGIGIQIAEWLVEQKVDAVLVQDDMQGKGPLYVLRDAGVTLSQVDPNIATRTLDDIIHWSREQEH
jgi:predicted Fe-Mo cluster-binding NifX family protein